MNIRAERSIQWPEKQEIGELQLNFIKLTPKANPIKRAIISATPLIAGLLAIWVIGVNVFQLETVMSLASSGQLEDVAKAVDFLISAPDFWLWFYISFTIANTMFPTIPKDMKGWWQIGGAIAVIVIALLILGIGQSLLSEIGLTLVQILNSLSAILLLTIGINITMVLILGLIEYTVERITGHSATFQKGKMITMTREEALQRKQEEQEKRLSARSSSRRRVTTDPASVYTFEFPIPGPPGQEPITKGAAAILGMESGSNTSDSIEEDDIIETTVTDSNRQRMLRLFPENRPKTENDDKPEKEHNLSSGRTLPTTDTDHTSDEHDDEKPAEPLKKPTFGVREFSQSDTPSEDVEAENTDKDDKKPLTSPLAKRPSLSPRGQEDKGKSPIQRSAPTPKSPPVEDIGTETKDDEVKDTADEKAVASTTDSDLSTLRKPVAIDKNNGEANNIARAKKEVSTPKASVDDVEDEGDELVDTINTETISKSDDIESSKEEIALDDDDIDERRKLESISSSAKTSSSRLKISSDEDEVRKSDTGSPFSRPFVKRDLPVFDEEDEDEEHEGTLEKDNSPFARPFAGMDESSESLIDTTSKLPSDWRSKLGSMSSDNDDEDEDDEQLTTRSPRSSSMFDSLNTSKTEDSKPASDWRSKLGSMSSDNDDEDEDDEQLTTRSPRSSSIFDSLNTSKTEDSKPASDWRSKLSSTSSDNDEDDEQLTTRSPRSSSMFDSLNTSKTEDSKPASDWRSKLSNMSSDNDDEDDEQLGGRSILSGLGRPKSSLPRSTIKGSGSRPAPKPSRKPTSSDWRSPLNSSDEEDEEDADIDEITYEPIDDEFIYEDDDEFSYDNDDGEFYDDDY